MRMRVNKLARHSSGTSLSNTSEREAQNTRGRGLLGFRSNSAVAPAFHFSGLRQLAAEVRRRSNPHFTSPLRFAQPSA